MTSRINRPFSPRLARSLKLGALVLAAATGYAIHAARAAGVPGSPDGLVYSGVATDGNGTPLTSATSINVAVYDAASSGNKVCDETKTPAEVDAEGNFSVAMDDCADAMHASANLWVEVTVDGVALGRTKIGAVPYALEAANAVQADIASDSELLEGKPASDFADADHGHVLADLPAELADGDQDTKYSPGTGLDLVQTTFSVDPTEVQTRVKQAAVSGAPGGCAAGFSIRTIAQDGSVVCEADTDTDTDTTYLAGTGLALTSNQFSFDAGDISWCGAGQALRSISGAAATCDTLPKLTSWATFTPSVTYGGVGVSGLTTNTGIWRRVGDTIEVQIITSFGSALNNANYVLWGLPNGVQADRLGAATFMVGTAMGFTGSSSASSCMIDTESGSSGGVFVWCHGGDALRRSNVGPGLVSTVALKFSTPVVGWTVNN